MTGLEQSFDQFFSSIKFIATYGIWIGVGICVLLVAYKQFTRGR